MTSPPSESWFARLVTGAKWGLAMGAILSCWAVLISLAEFISRGSLTITAKHGTTYHVAGIVAAYLASGVIVGALFGVFQRALASTVGAALLGMLAAAPLFVLFALLRSEVSGWGMRESLALAVFVPAFGIPGGLIVRQFLYGKLRSRRRAPRSKER